MKTSNATFSRCGGLTREIEPLTESEMARLEQVLVGMRMEITDPDTEASHEVMRILNVRRFAALGDDGTLMEASVCGDKIDINDAERILRDPLYYDPADHSFHTETLRPEELDLVVEQLLLFRHAKLYLPEEGRGWARRCACGQMIYSDTASDHLGDLWPLGAIHHALKKDGFDISWPFLEWVVDRGLITANRHHQSRYDETSLYCDVDEFRKEFDALDLERLREEFEVAQKSGA